MAAIVALDIATSTGWAILDDRSPNRPFLGTLKLSSDVGEIGRAAEELRSFLAERSAMHGGISDLVFEEQHIAFHRKPKKGAKGAADAGSTVMLNMGTIKRLVGLATMAEWFAFRISARCYSVAIGSWRKHAFGSARITRDQAKVRAMEECRALGFDPSNDNEAEAFFVLDYYIALRNKHGASIPQPWRDNAFFDRTGAQR